MKEYVEDYFWRIVRLGRQKRRGSKGRWTTSAHLRKSKLNALIPELLSIWTHKTKHLSKEQYEKGIAKFKTEFEEMIKPWGEHISKHTIEELPSWTRAEDHKTRKLVINLYDAITLDGMNLVAKPSSTWRDYWR